MNHRAGIAGIVLTLFFSVIGAAICRAADQDLLVANFAYPFDVIRYDGDTGSSVTPGVTFADGVDISFPRGITYGPDGHLYVANEGTGDIQKYDGATYAFISTFIPGSYGFLETPKGLIFDPAGDYLFVTSHDAPTACSASTPPPALTSMTCSNSSRPSAADWLIRTASPLVPPMETSTSRIPVFPARSGNMTASPAHRWACLSPPAAEVSAARIS